MKDPRPAIKKARARIRELETLQKNLFNLINSYFNLGVPFRQEQVSRYTQALENAWTQILDDLESEISE